MAGQDRLEPVLASSTPADLWTALVSDTDRAIVVVSPEGQVLFANDEAARHVGVTDPERLVGRLVRELCDDAYAEERLSCIREVAATGRVLAMDGMTFGRMRRTIMRPIGARPDGARYVLMTHVPVPADSNHDQDDRLEIRRATIDDYGPLASLSERELQVLTLIAQGKTTAEIAKAMHRSVKTVEWHRVALGSKLQVSNRVELARIAIAAGLVSIDDAPDLQGPQVHPAQTQPASQDHPANGSTTSPETH